MTVSKQKGWKWAAAAAIMIGGIVQTPVAARATEEGVKPEVELQGVDRLLAMEDMKNLRLTFCRSLDGHDWTSLRATMADDFELYLADESGNPGSPLAKPVTMTGADNFMGFVKQLLAQGQSIHICTMPQFLYVGKDRARALWFINGYGNIGGQTGLGFERVVEDYIHVNGKWLIQKADARGTAHVTFSK
ncbi:nuclear transport factor 2 family protein [Sphingopyxis sp. 550A]